MFQNLNLFFLKTFVIANELFKYSNNFAQTFATTRPVLQKVYSRFFKFIFLPLPCDYFKDFISSLYVKKDYFIVIIDFVLKLHRVSEN